MGRRYYITEGEKEKLAASSFILAVIATVALGIIIFAPLKVTLFIFGAIFSLIFFWVLFVAIGVMVGGKVGASEVKDMPTIDITDLVMTDSKEKQYDPEADSKK